MPAEPPLTPHRRPWSDVDPTDPQLRRARMDERAASEDAEERVGLAADPDAPLDHVRLLATDDHRDVRRAVAERDWLPADVTDLLIADDDPQVRARAVVHVPLRRLAALVGDPSPEVLTAVAARDDITDDVLHLVADMFDPGGDTDHYRLRFQLVSLADRLTPDHLDRLMELPNGEVSDQVMVLLSREAKTSRVVAQVADRWAELVGDGDRRRVSEALLDSDVLPDEHRVAIALGRPQR